MSLISLLINLLYFAQLKMKLKLSKSQLQGLPPAQWLRRAGYNFIVDRQSGQESFARRFTRDLYPRFHLYVQEIAGGEELFFNLHLDHKKASYAGQTRHSADYDGELVEQEFERLQGLLGSVRSALNNATKQPDTARNQPQRSFQSPSGDVLKTFSTPSLLVPKIAKKSWWQKLFS